MGFGQIDERRDQKSANGNPDSSGGKNSLAVLVSAQLSLWVEEKVRMHQRFIIIPWVEQTIYLSKPCASIALLR